MPKSRPPYAPAFRCRVVELARSGRPFEEPAREFGPRPGCRPADYGLIGRDRRRGRQAQVLHPPGPAKSS